MEPNNEEVIYSSALNEDDVRNYVAFNSERALAPYAVWYWAAFAGALIAPIPVIIAAEGASGDAQLTYFLTVGVMLLTYSLLNSLVARRMHQARSRHATALLAPRRFAISAKGLSVESRFGTGFVPWSGVRDIARKDQIVVFWLDSMSAYCARADAGSDSPDAGPLYQLAK